jgi:hypothetical protein
VDRRRVRQRYTGRVRVDRAFTLFETHNKWARAGLVSSNTLPPHSSGTVVLGNRSVLELWEPEIFIAFRVRSGARKLPFSLKVSLEPQESVVPQRPPRRMPLLAETWPRRTQSSQYRPRSEQSSTSHFGLSGKERTSPELLSQYRSRSHGCSCSEGTRMRCLLAGSPAEVRQRLQIRSPAH